ncbi:MAG: hypothetical protein J5787_00540 [Alphaproteobacteria bacterium]|nr:hypothetical protein [Alphaproteobacteria bacterium]MBO4643868.1 hypothetical protein [Alphaproteobacteria bacterium]
MSLLYEAVKNDDLRALKKALKEPCPADELAGALRNASEKGQIRQIKCLLSAGAHDDWAIAAAASFASVETVKLLYKRIGGDLNAALIGAAAHGRLETTRFLLTTPASTLNEALADAVLRKYHAIVGLLLEKGADPFAPVYGGQTAAGIAERKGDRELEALFDARQSLKK